MLFKKAVLIYFYYKRNCISILDVGQLTFLALVANISEMTDTGRNAIVNVTGTAVLTGVL